MFIFVSTATQSGKVGDEKIFFLKKKGKKRKKSDNLNIKIK